MAWNGSLALSMVAAAFAVIGASPITAQSLGASQSHSTSTMTAGQPPRQQVRVLNIPGYPTTYVVADLPKDTRSARQRCMDEEIAKAGGSPSDLTLASIDLKCSQR